MTAAELYERAKYFFPPPPGPELGCRDAIKAPVSAGVYFIHEAGSIVYVGESIRVRDRLQGHEHLTDGRMVSVIECDALQRRRLEAFYIGVLNPPLNRESSDRCPVKYRRTAAKAAGGSYRSRQINLVVKRMEEWAFITEQIVATPGRPRRVYFVNENSGGRTT
jgi:hypothetical protein